MSLLDRVVESGLPSALDTCASMTRSTSKNFEELGKQLCTSVWFLGSFCVRSLAALIVPALMMLIAAIWVRCGLALVGLGPLLDDAMLFGCSWGRFSILVVVQLLPGVSSCVCESQGRLHFLLSRRQWSVWDREGFSGSLLQQLRGWVSSCS